jgi:N-acetylneuraminic acid mutarotase
MPNSAQLYKVIFILILSYLFWSCNTPADSPYPSIAFIPLQSIPGNGRSSAVGFSINGKGYVALGRDSLNNPLNDCWQYDPGLNLWNKKASFPGIGRVKAVATVINNKAFVGMGFNPLIGVYTEKSAYLKDFWIYDPLNDSWTRKADFPSDDCDACVGFSFGNFIYVGSGFNGFGFGGSFWKYDTTIDNWSQLKDFPENFRSGAVVCTNGERVFFGTGYDTYNENDWWEYFPTTDTWKKLNSMPDQGRENGVSLSLKNRFFVSTGRQFGGNLTGGHIKSDIVEYDAIRNVWYERGNIPTGNRENAIAFVIDNKGYIGFGENDTRVLNDFWSFEP